MRSRYHTIDIVAEVYIISSNITNTLVRYFKDVIELPSTFEQLRTTAAGNCLRVLVDHLSNSCDNPAIVNALL